MEGFISDINSERKIIETNPKNPDSDYDQLWDGPDVGYALGELIIHFKNIPGFADQANPTDPMNPDSDGDGALDGQECNGWDIRIFYEAEPSHRDSSRHVISNPLVPDTDGDGVTDGDELFLNGDPTNSDTDDDGINDAEEKEWGGNLNGKDGEPPEISGSGPIFHLDVKLNWDHWDITITFKHIRDNAGLSTLKIDIDGTTVIKNLATNPPTRSLNDYSVSIKKPYDGKLISDGNWQLNLELTDLSNNLRTYDPIEIPIQEVAKIVILNVAIDMINRINELYQKAKEWIKEEIRQFVRFTIEKIISIATSPCLIEQLCLIKTYGIYALAYLSTWKEVDDSDDALQALSLWIQNIRNPQLRELGNGLIGMMNMADDLIDLPVFLYNTIVTEVQWQLVYNKAFLDSELSDPVTIHHTLYVMESGEIKITAPEPQSKNNLLYYYAHPGNSDNTIIPFTENSRMILSPTFAKPIRISLADNTIFEILIYSEQKPSIDMIVLKAPFDIKEISIGKNNIDISPYDLSNGNIYKLTVTLPSDDINYYAGARNGLFNIQLKYAGEIIAEEPHSLQIKATKNYRNGKFVQLTDIHIGKIGTDYVFNDAIDYLNNKYKDNTPNNPYKDLDYIIITGDLANGGMMSTFWKGKDLSYNSRESEYRKIRDIALKSEVPIFMIPGNHDYLTFLDEDIMPIITPGEAIGTFFWYLLMDGFQETITWELKSFGDVGLNSLDNSLDTMIDAFETYGIHSPGLCDDLQTRIDDYIDVQRTEIEDLVLNIEAMHAGAPYYNLHKYNQYVNPNVNTLISGTTTWTANPNDYYLGDYWPIGGVAVDSGHSVVSPIGLTLSGFNLDQQDWIKDVYNSRRDYVAFVFTHAPVVADPQNFEGIPPFSDPTHMADYDEKFIEWLNDPVEHPTIEVVVTGHTHQGDTYVFDLSKSPPKRNKANEPYNIYEFGVSIDWLDDSYTGRDHISISTSVKPYRTILYTAIQND